MIRRVEKGDRITSEMLNQIKRGVSQRILGGKGINVQNVGGRTVISRKREQIVPQLGDTTGCVWKLRASSGKVVWGYSNGGSINAVCSYGGAVYVCSGPVTTWDGGGGVLGSVAKLSSNGDLVWLYNTTTSGTTSFQARGIATDGTHVFVYSSISGTWTGAGGNANVWKLDCADGSVVATQNFGYGGSGFNQARVNGLSLGGDYLYAIFGPNPGGGTYSKVVQMDKNLNVLYNGAAPVHDVEDMFSVAANATSWGIATFTDYPAPHVGSTLVSHYNTSNVNDWSVVESPVVGEFHAGLAIGSAKAFSAYCANPSPSVIQVTPKQYNNTTGGVDWTFPVITLSGSAFGARKETMTCKPDDSMVWLTTSIHSDDYTGSTTNQQRNLFCFDDAGTLLYTWSNAEDPNQSGNPPDNLTGSFYADNHVYVCGDLATPLLTRGT